MSLSHRKLNFQCGNLTQMLVSHRVRVTLFVFLCLVREDWELRLYRAIVKPNPTSLV